MGIARVARGRPIQSIKGPSGGGPRPLACHRGDCLPAHYAAFNTPAAACWSIESRVDASIELAVAGGGFIQDASIDRRGGRTPNERASPASNQSIDRSFTGTQSAALVMERAKKKTSEPVPQQLKPCLPNALVSHSSRRQYQSNQPTTTTFLNRNPLPFRPKHARARTGSMSPSHARSPDSSSFLSLPCDASCPGLTSASRLGSASASRIQPT